MRQLTSCRLANKVELPRMAEPSGTPATPGGRDVRRGLVSTSPDGRAIRNAHQRGCVGGVGVVSTSPDDRAIRNHVHRLQKGGASRRVSTSPDGRAIRNAAGLRGAVMAGPVSTSPDGRAIRNGFPGSASIQAFVGFQLPRMAEPSGTRARASEPGFISCFNFPGWQSHPEQRSQK